MPSKLQLLAVPLVLAILLFAVSAAHAVPVTPSVTPLAFEEEFAAEEGEGEEGEGELEAADCEEAEEEFDEGELSGAEVKEICDEAAAESRMKAAGTGAVAPEECILRSAHANAVTDADSNKLKLTVGYTTYEPATATLDYSLVGSKGSLHMKTAKRQLGRSGVIRLTAALADPEMDKADAARHFVVRLHVTGSPSSCQRFETEQLSVKRASKDQAVWSQAK
ncbi:MAG TPA: hypothetical protein VK471_01875 [Solirubrobacterales bacterium]|nr:hypothetical protein [Solirubrobacterales bacterium]